jgi:hypothetical protein
MAAFRLMVNPGDWGSPLQEQPSFATLEEAQAAAREYRAEQRREGGPNVTGALLIEETRPDGSMVNHPVA